MTKCNGTCMIEGYYQLDGLAGRKTRDFLILHSRVEKETYSREWSCKGHPAMRAKGNEEYES